MSGLLRAEELAVLLIRDNGRLVTSSSEVDLVLAGALLADLDSEGHADVRAQTERDDDDAVIGRRNRVRSLGMEPPGDPLLADAFTKINERRKGNAIRRVSKGARGRVYARLAERELVSVTKGLLSRTYTVLDVGLRNEIRHRFHQVLVNGLSVDPRTLSEIWLFDACASLGKALPGADRGTIRQNRERLPEPGWVEKQTRTEINSVRAASASAASG